MKLVGSGLLFATVLAVSGCLVSSADAALITTFDFTDGNWSATNTQSGSVSPGQNLSSVVDGTVAADKNGGSGGARITVTLTGSISTVGFEDITLEFFGSGTGNSTGMEWDADLTSPVNSTDGLRIVGSGVTVDANGINGTASEAAFVAGSTFSGTSGNTGSFSAADFTFDPSVDDSSITNMTFILQINANDEVLFLNNVGVFGTPISTVPEPSSAIGLAVLSGLSLLGRRRRRVMVG